MMDNDNHKPKQEKLAKVPFVLNGKFFKITSEQGGKIVAKCLHCAKTEISGTKQSTSNFLRHLRVSYLLFIF
jgi:BED zinc finger